MSIFFHFISSIYLKNFFILFFALVGFYCGIDLLLNFKDLPASANLILLYVLFVGFSAVTYILPISLIFALVLSFLTMIRNNEFVSLYALGLSKNRVIIYPFLWALLFCFIYVGLNFTSFAYANEYKRSILKNGVLNKKSSDIFLKFNEEFVYVKSLDEGLAKELKIFSLKDGNLSYLIQAKRALFNENSWLLEEGNITYIPKEFALGENGYKSENFANLETLEGFKPKLAKSVASGKEYSIYDAYQSLILFDSQGLNTRNVKITLYKLIFAPFFAPFLMLIMYYYFPVIARFFNLAFVAFVAFVVTLVVWGGLFVFLRLSENGVISGEFGIILPNLLLAFFALLISYKKC
ncbi:LptF/LptG family permease [Campylobacter upsaliensis]|uniref:LptF/LptG family permease n=1 Tax=Campylobacter upsaliensis TaxID=28080 RepID=UPI000E127A7B|nr:LptF/LptG family permease [Campylobacter upsaliensis]EAH5217747.1 LptF/LptG family permease [Campylobacter upsaliensis]EAH5675779.1 LptF/LptG family permease [Campylobacter upsaliensis]EAH5847453.1 LptF/LptG family permease [Campylobacter upsaliensis]EAH5879180.1 LptF/LptG family permease [Campylobacter upsaliensis]EAH5977376.1 LptF/LptG family permease [Campylobacter upsaliensis]